MRSTSAGLLSLILLLAPASALPRRLDSPFGRVQRRAPPQASAGQPLLPRDIQGSGYVSPYLDQVVQVQGVVTAKSSAGFYIQTEPSMVDKVDSISEGLYVFGSNSVGLVQPGDLVTLSGTVAEYASDDTYLRLTELTFPTNVTVVSKGNAIAPIVLGVDRTPPGSTVYFKDPFSLDAPVDIELIDKKLKPKDRGLDFWESLEGMLVRVPSPRAVSRTSSYGDAWIVGESYATHSNSRGGLTINIYPGGWDANAEAVKLSKALDGSNIPKTTVMGTRFEDIVGIVSYAFGAPVIFPVTAPVIKSQPAGSYPPSSIKGDGRCKVSLGQYNVLNLSPRSKATQFSKLGDHIANYLGSPDVVGLEEIQDDNGATNDGVTSGLRTLQALIDAIKSAGGPTYTALEIAPIDLQDGGAPGGNIRPAILYRADRLELDPLSPAGSNTQSQSIVLDTATGEATFGLNPGLIDPSNAAWDNSRKPLSASFFVRGATGVRKRLHVIVAHFASKSGSGTANGRFQPAENGAVQARIAQAELVGQFVDRLVKADPKANVVLLGDLNELNEVQPITTLQKYMTQLELKSPEERYSYSFDQNSQQIDHIFATKTIAKTAEFEILHLNTWGLVQDQSSDHDPLLASFLLC